MIGTGCDDNCMVRVYNWQFTLEQVELINNRYCQTKCNTCIPQSVLEHSSLKLSYVHSVSRYYRPLIYQLYSIVSRRKVRIIYGNIRSTLCSRLVPSSWPTEIVTPVSENKFSSRFSYHIYRTVHDMDVKL